MIFFTNSLTIAGVNSRHAHILADDGGEAVKVCLVLLVGMNGGLLRLNKLRQFLSARLHTPPTISKTFMGDCAVDIVLVNPLENPVKFGYPFPCLFQCFLFRFTPFPLLETLLIDRSETLYVVKEHSAVTQISVAGQTVSGFFSDIMCGASARIALVVGTAVTVLSRGQAACLCRNAAYSHSQRNKASPENSLAVPLAWRGGVCLPVIPAPAQILFRQ